MKKVLCFLLFLSLFLHPHCFAETDFIPADDDDVVTMLETALEQAEFDYSCVTLNRNTGVFVVDIAFDGLTENVLMLKQNGYDENVEQWLQIKSTMQSMYDYILELFKGVHREDLRLIVNVVNDDAYLREDYSTISHNPLLSIGIFGMVIVDEMASN